MNYRLSPANFPALLWPAAALFFVLPIPHTIALRDLLALICLGLFAYGAYRDGRPHLPAPARLPLFLILALLAWLIAAGLVLSPHRDAVLREIWSQWGRGLIFFSLGAMLASMLRPGQHRLWLTALFGVLFAHVLYADVQALNLSISQMQWAQRVTGLTSGPDRLNLLQQLLLAFLLAESLCRLAGQGRTLPLGRGALAIAWIVTMLGFLFSSMRNGLISLAVFFVLFLALLQVSRRVSRRATLGLILGLVVALAAGATISWRSDPRWQSLAETVPLGLDTQTHKAWLDFNRYPLPLLANGEPVIHSNYLRLAWMKEGLLLVREHPLGVGFERAAFGRGLQAKYGEGLGQHSHSGLLDLAIGGGLPALGLWLAFLFVVFREGWRAWSTRRDINGALLVFIVADYFVRSIVDSIVRDYMLLQFLLLTGALMVAMNRYKDESNTIDTRTA